MFLKFIVQESEKLQMAAHGTPSRRDLIAGGCARGMRAVALNNLAVVKGLFSLGSLIYFNPF